ncbi:polysaccharide deacetylase family protein [Stappia sp. F7233]|uniref:Chitooligosaccharide deacetylase n=1 Tax=Stappia albiluteola TaxID=2758565 RepID=A0A839AAB3_9HYPH|nr:polysaccharide deacetylase family protein [Stappia albiluteola]MBA5776126.1 polysaccharide deacetylase family protein [Stappia albiluteola]
MDLRRAILAGSCHILTHTGAGRLLAPFTQGAGLIFTLHKVEPARQAGAFAPNGHLTVTPEFLEATIAQVRAAGIEFVSLDEAVRRLKHGGSERRFAAITLDDGYRNNLEFAYPIFRKHGVPFTIFVASGFVDRNSEIWWEALERIVAGSDHIEIPIGARMERLPARSVAEKISAYSRAASWLSCDTGEAAQRLEIRRLATQHGLDLKELADELILSWDELRRLCEDPLATVGGHTHDHFALARLSRGEMRDNVRLGLERLEAELGVRPRHFAYPYGYEAAVDRRSVETLKEFGFDCALTTRPGMLKDAAHHEMLALPRISLNGYFQHAAIVSQFLTGAPFPFYNMVRGIKERLVFLPGSARVPNPDRVL